MSDIFGAKRRAGRVECFEYAAAVNAANVVVRTPPDGYSVCVVSLCLVPAVGTTNITLEQAGVARLVLPASAGTVLQLNDLLMPGLNGAIQPLAADTQLTFSTAGVAGPFYVRLVTDLYRRSVIDAL